MVAGRGVRGDADSLGAAAMGSFPGKENGHREEGMG